MVLSDLKKGQMMVVEKVLTMASLMDILMVRTIVYWKVNEMDRKMAWLMECLLVYGTVKM